MRLTLTVTDQLALAERQFSHPGYALLGIRVDPVSASLAQSVGLAATAGVVVVEVVTGSPADSAGIDKGDIIFQVDGEDVNDQDQFRQHVGDAIQTGSVVVLLRDSVSGRDRVHGDSRQVGRTAMPTWRLSGTDATRWPRRTAVASASTPRSIPNP